jgi:hypothetical protein
MATRLSTTIANVVAGATGPTGPAGPAGNSAIDQSTSSTGFISLPSGNTAQRPISTANGYMRFNTQLNAVETYSAISSKWEILSYFTVPDTPTIGTAYVTGSTTANVSYTAPANTGNGTTAQAITSYTAVSSPGGVTNTLSQAGSGTINMSGLTANTSYTFSVYATNSAGNSSASANSNRLLLSA